MKTKHKIVTLIIITFSGFQIGFAQNEINGNNDVIYIYDDAGNRIQRNIVITNLTSEEEEVLASSRSIVQEKTTIITTDLYAVYPNPTSNYVNIEAKEGSLVGGTVSIMDMTGRALYTASMNGGIYKLDMSGYDSGTYVLWIQSGDVVVTKKVIKY